MKKHSLKAGRLRLRCNLSLSINIFSLQRWLAVATHSLFTRTVNSAALHSHRSSSRSIPNGCLSLKIQSGAVFVYCIFWGIPHSWLKGIPCALTCFSLWTEGGQSSSQSQCLWLPFIGTGPESLRTSILQSRPDTCAAGLLQTRSFETQISIPQRHKSIHIQYNTQGIQFDAQT